MTKEEIIDNLELYTVGRPKKDRVSITVEELQSLIDEIKALEQQPTTQEILSHIETGITATGQSDSYCVGFCNALIWLKSCITHEEPQFFEDSKVSEISTGSTTTDDCVSRQAVLDKKVLIELPDGQSFYCIGPEDVESLPPVTPTHGTCKDCFYYNIDEDGHGYHCEKYGHTRFPVYVDFYCKDFEKRGSENGSN